MFLFFQHLTVIFLIQTCVMSQVSIPRMSFYVSSFLNRHGFWRSTAAWSAYWMSLGCN